MYSLWESTSQITKNTGGSGIHPNEDGLTSSSTDDTMTPSPTEKDHVEEEHSSCKLTRRPSDGGAGPPDEEHPAESKPVKRNTTPQAFVSAEDKKMMAFHLETMKEEKKKDEELGAISSHSNDEAQMAKYIPGEQNQGEPFHGAIAVMGANYHSSASEQGDYDEESSARWQGANPYQEQAPGGYGENSPPVLEARVVQHEEPSELAEEVRQLRAEMAHGLWIPEGENVVSAQPMPEKPKASGPCATREKRRRALAIAIVACIVFVALGIGLGLGLSNDGDDGTSTQMSVEELLLAEPLVDNAALDDVESPQYKALAWLKNNTHFDDYPDWQRLQRFALATLYFSTDGDNWHDKREWLTDVDVCGWYNMDEDRCNDGNNLARLTLEGNNLNGTIPAELGVLSDSLMKISFASNKLHGTIPSEVGLMRRLEQLFFQKNSLTGTIPTEIGEFKIMKEFFLDRNDLVGSIPTEVGRMAPSLGRLLLFKNHLTGAIPTEVGLLPQLQMLRIGDNKFTGALPSELGLLTNKFDWLTVNDCGLSGSIPNEFSSLAIFKKIELQNNLLTGTIPEFTTRFPILEKLLLYGNNFTGNYTCAPSVPLCLISCEENVDSCRTLNGTL